MLRNVSLGVWEEGVQIAMKGKTQRKLWGIWQGMVEHKKGKGEQHFLRWVQGYIGLYDVLDMDSPWKKALASAENMK